MYIHDFVFQICISCNLERICYFNMLYTKSLNDIFFTFHSTETNPGKHLGNLRKDNLDNTHHGTLLSEDYAEIVDDEGDYSTPASK